MVVGRKAPAYLVMRGRQPLARLFGINRKTVYYQNPIKTVLIVFPIIVGYNVTMNKTRNSAPKGSAMSIGKAAKPSIKSLIADLESKDGIIRVKARRQLVAYKARSVAPLTKTLSNENHWVRWEAAKALSQIANPASIQALLGALSDTEFDVRWLAAEGLIRIGRKVVVPLLETLVEYSDSLWLREGIHHVLHDMNRGNLEEKTLHPVLTALEGTEPSLEAPLAAQKALDVLKNHIPHRNFTI
jgi:HEAT repeat protein